MVTLTWYWCVKYHITNFIKSNKITKRITKISKKWNIHTYIILKLDDMLNQNHIDVIIDEGKLIFPTCVSLYPDEKKIQWYTSTYF